MGGIQSNIIHTHYHYVTMTIEFDLTFQQGERFRPKILSSTHMAFLATIGHRVTMTIELSQNRTIELDPTF